jgi:hypothetical protein
MTTRSNKLNERLTDALKSGVFRAPNKRAVLDAAAGGDFDLVAISLGKGKDAMLSSMAKALGFPEWFGGNWDALEDSLTDLSWRPDKPRVLLFSDATAGDELGVLIDILSSAAEFWKERGRAFFAVFADPESRLPLPRLYKERAG